MPLSCELPPEKTWMKHIGPQTTFFRFQSQTSSPALIMKMMTSMICLPISTLHHWRNPKSWSLEDPFDLHAVTDATEALAKSEAQYIPCEAINLGNMSEPGIRITCQEPKDCFTSQEPHVRIQTSQMFPVTNQKGQVFPVRCQMFPVRSQKCQMCSVRNQKWQVFPETNQRSWVKNLGGSYAAKLYLCFLLNWSLESSNSRKRDVHVMRKWI